MTRATSTDLQRFANRALRSGLPARAFTHLGLSGNDDFGSSGAGILGSSGLLGAGAVAGDNASVFSCGCSGLTLKREVDPACTWFAGCSALSAVESSSPARLPRLSAFSRLRLISCGCSYAQHVDGRILTPIGLGTVASMRLLPGGKAPAAQAASTLTFTQFSCAAGAHALARMDFRRSLADVRRCEGDIPTCNMRRSIMSDAALSHLPDSTAHACACDADAAAEH